MVRLALDSDGDERPLEILDLRITMPAVHPCESTGGCEPRVVLRGGRCS